MLFILCVFGRSFHVQSTFLNAPALKQSRKLKLSSWTTYDLFELQGYGFHVTFMQLAMNNVLGGKTV